MHTDINFKITAIADEIASKGHFYLTQTIHDILNGKIPSECESADLNREEIFEVLSDLYCVATANACVCSTDSYTGTHIFNEKSSEEF